MRFLGGAIGEEVFYTKLLKCEMEQLEQYKWCFFLDELRRLFQLYRLSRSFILLSLFTRADVEFGRIFYGK